MEQLPPEILQRINNHLMDPRNRVSLRLTRHAIANMLPSVSVIETFLRYLSHIQAHPHELVHVVYKSVGGAWQEGGGYELKFERSHEPGRFVIRELTSDRDSIYLRHIKRKATMEDAVAVLQKGPWQPIESMDLEHIYNDDEEAPWFGRETPRGFQARIEAPRRPQNYGDACNGRLQLASERPRGIMRSKRRKPLYNSWVPLNGSYVLP